MNTDELRHPRVQRFDEHRERYGERFLRLVEGLYRMDPAADRAMEALSAFPYPRQGALIDAALAGDVEEPEVPEALRELVEQARAVPSWVDWSRVERGAATLMGTGVLGGITLGAKSLVEGYCAPAGNKPLAMSGRLQDKAAKRLNETARFVEAVGTSGGMRPGAEGFNITLRVRLMHARVRSLIAASSRWREERWAQPINQHDMVATIHLFSTSFMEGVQTLGMDLSPLEQEDFLHLWRYVGHVIGVEGFLLPRSVREAQEQWQMISGTQGPPDEDSRALTMALLEEPLNQASNEEERRRAQKHVAFGKQVCRTLIGDERADELGIERAPLARAFPLLRRVVRVLDKGRRWSAVEHRMVQWGRRYWQHTVAAGAMGQPIRFALPKGLRSDGLAS